MQNVVDFLNQKVKVVPRFQEEEIMDAGQNLL